MRTRSGVLVDDRARGEAPAPAKRARRSGGGGGGEYTIGQLLDDVLAGGGEEARVAEAAVTPAPKAASLQALLEQALQTGDHGQLEMCLGVADARVIEATVARLGAAKVIPLLTAVIARFEARPARGAALLPWLRAVLVQHTGHLMAVPGLVQRLSRLYQTLDARLATFKKLLKLDGRLDVVLSQLSLQRCARAACPAHA